MAKRKLKETGMHPNNPYFNNPPDFVALAKLYPSLAPFVKLKSFISASENSSSQTKGFIDFQDPLALRELTYCLLRKDFSIDLDIPLDSLCPPIPNRLNYICWIEDLLDGESIKEIHGIDINHLGKTIRVTMNDSTKIFPDSLFEDPNTSYDFCMCNPPFYKDEQDIQESAEAKESQPSAICRGTTNEMITVGGETQFVIQMVDESICLNQKVRWYTSMLGKRSSVDVIIAYLKKNKILNYTMTTFHQGQTSRWAIAWSHGNAHASRASMQHISNKLIKLMPPKSILSFQCAGLTLDSIISAVERLLDQLLIQYYSDDVDTRAVSDMAHVLHCTAARNTWTRAARRVLARSGGSQDKDDPRSVTKELTVSLLEPVVLQFDVRISSASKPVVEETSSLAVQDVAVSTLIPHVIEFIWTVGEDRDLFESCFLHLRNRFRQQGHTTDMQEQPAKAKIHAP
ncbi:Methyltransferase-like protein 16 [Linnemannia zychae]|nr:Methyltransferase-like protein 16 [Linnemannia zychae]